MSLTLVSVQHSPLITTVPDKIPWATFSLHSGNSFWSSAPSGCGWICTVWGKWTASLEASEGWQVKVNIWASTLQQILKVSGLDHTHPLPNNTKVVHALGKCTETQVKFNTQLLFHRNATRPKKLTRQVSFFVCFFHPATTKRFACQCSHMAK